MQDPTSHSKKLMRKLKKKKKKSFRAFKYPLTIQLKEKLHNDDKYQMLSVHISQSHSWVSARAVL